MPKIKISFQEKVTNTWVTTIRIPQEVIDEGEAAMILFAQENEDLIWDNGQISESDTEETLMNLTIED